MTVQNIVWKPNPGPQTSAFICDCDEVFFGGGRGCVHPDTLLDTPNGKIKIKDFHGGEIYSYKDGKVITTYATKSVEGTEEDLYEVVLINGSSVICTDEHKFLVNRDDKNPHLASGWVMLKDLHPMHYIFTGVIKNSLCFVPLSSAVLVGRMKYWDLHVPETNCYFAQGILHHNSGKSSLLFGKVLQHIEKNRGKSKMIFFRENFDDLSDLIDKGKDILEKNGVADYISGQTKTFRFKPPFEGAWLKMRQIEHIDDLKHYKGHEYTLIAFDEICDFKLPFDTISDVFMATLRNPHGIKSQILYTGNPGGYNHTAIKRYFIDPWSPGNRIIKNEFGQTRAYFQSTVDDNPHLASDPIYMRQLERIKDPVLRKAWRYGDWSVALGAMFADVWEPKKHIIQYSITPQDIPEHFDRFRCFDWGSSTPFCYLRAFLSTGEELNNKRGCFPAGSVVFYNEYYGWKPGNKVNEGLKLSSSEVAEEIRRREVSDGDIRFLKAGPADTQIFQVLDGTPIYDSFYKQGVSFIPAIKSAGSNVTGWELIRNRLIGYDDKPQIYFTKDCVHTIRTLPTLSRHKIHLDSMADYQEDHCLVAGTLVETSEGQKPIEMITSSDMVMTRSGFSKVKWSKLTGENKSVLRIVSSTCTLDGTEYHPIYTLKDGWVFLKDIKKLDILLGDVKWMRTLFSLMGLNTGDTLNQVDHATEVTINQHHPKIERKDTSHSIEQYGYFIKEKFLKATTFITLMATLAIMIFPTLIWLIAANILGCTLGVIHLLKKTMKKPLSLQPCGTNQMKENCGTNNMEKNHGKTDYQLTIPARIVVSFIRLGIVLGSVISVPRIAGQLGVGKAAEMMSRGIALSVESLLSKINTHLVKHVPTIVLENYRVDQKKNVYNLEVEGMHEYYANGVLVHNCVDCLKYLILSLSASYTPDTMNDKIRDKTSRDRFLEELMTA